MQINLCPKCGREPTRIRYESMSRKTIGHEIVCKDCGISTWNFKRLSEAVAKWNEMTKGENK